jgi:hypothetical protein
MQAMCVCVSVCVVYMQDYDERDRIRANAARDARWQKYVKDGRRHVVHQVRGLGLARIVYMHRI